MDTRRKKGQPHRHWIGNYPTPGRAEEVAQHLNGTEWHGYFSAGPPKIVEGHPETKDMGGLYKARHGPK